MYVIRIRFFGSGETIQRTFRAVQYCLPTSHRLICMTHVWSGSASHVAKRLTTSLPWPPQFTCTSSCSVHRSKGTRAASPNYLQPSRRHLLGGNLAMHSTCDSWAMNLPFSRPLPGFSSLVRFSRCGSSSSYRATLSVSSNRKPVLTPRIRRQRDRRHPHSRCPFQSHLHSQPSLVSPQESRQPLSS